VVVASRGPTKAGTPGIVPNVRFDSITSNSAQANWGKPSSGGDDPLTGFGLLLWTGPDHPDYGDAFVVGKDSRNHVYTGLQPDTTYKFRIHACNGTDSCGWWTNPPVEFTTLEAPTPAPQPSTPTTTPTATPTATAAPTATATPTPAPGRFRFSAAVAAQVYRAGQLVSVQLPAATGGSGHVTYTLSPAPGNGLSFDGPTRTIAGTPSQAANQATYTYTATDAKKKTVAASVPLTVFDLHLMTWHRDDDTYRRIGDGAFVDAVYSRWGVLEYAGVEPREPITRTDGSRFQVRLPAHPGFQVGTTCTWPAKAPTTTKTLQSPWIAIGQAFAFARCSLGSGRTATVEFWVRDAAGAESLLETRRLGGQQAWHQADHKALYYVRGTAADGTIKLVESDVDVGDGLFPKPRPANLDPTVTPGPTYTPNPILGSPQRYVVAAGIWNAVDGVTVGAAESRAQADAVIQGYWDTDPRDGNDGVCRSSIACVYLSGHYPHLESGLRFMIEDPPHWGSDAQALTWTLDFDLAKRKPSEFQYLPAVLVHELGHVLGLGHSNGPSDIMNGKVRQIGCTGSNCGLSTSDREGAEAIYTRTHHVAH